MTSAYISITGPGARELAERIRDGLNKTVLVVDGGAGVGVDFKAALSRMREKDQAIETAEREPIAPVSYKLASLRLTFLDIAEAILEYKMLPEVFLTDAKLEDYKTTLGVLKTEIMTKLQIRQDHARQAGERLVREEKRNEDLRTLLANSCEQIDELTEQLENRPLYPQGASTWIAVHSILETMAKQPRDAHDAALLRTLLILSQAHLPDEIKSQEEKVMTQFGVNEAGEYVEQQPLPRAVTAADLNEKFRTHYPEGAQAPLSAQSYVDETGKVETFTGSAARLNDED